MSERETIRLYATEDHACSYLPDEQARVLFVDPEFPIDESSYYELNRLGFRRSGKHFYRPECKACSACIATRVCVSEFEPSRSQKRVLKNNQDLSVRECTGIENFDKHYQLFEKYIRLRHADGDMYPASRQQFQQFIDTGSFNTHFTEFWHHDELISVSVKDRLADGWSAIYTYFDPDQESRSPGVLAILQMIEHARLSSLDYVYLGYWIEKSDKMNYKTQYRPVELYTNQVWQRVL